MAVGWGGGGVIWGGGGGDWRGGGNKGQLEWPPQ